jgi:hypothetical protein
MIQKPNGRKDVLKEKDRLGDQGKMGGLVSVNVKNDLEYVGGNWLAEYRVKWQVL